MQFVLVRAGDFSTCFLVCGNGDGDGGNGDGGDGDGGNGDGGNGDGGDGDGGNGDGGNGDGGYGNGDEIGAGEGRRVGVHEHSPTPSIFFVLANTVKSDFSPSGNVSFTSYVLPSMKTFFPLYAFQKRGDTATMLSIRVFWDPSAVTYAPFLKRGEK